MFALISRILNLSGRYKSRIQAAFLCAFVESILSKMPIFMAFIVLAGFADNTLTGKTCLFVGLGLLAVVVVQTVVHYLSDRLQSAAGFMIFADKRMELGNHLRKMPMGYFTSGNIGKISSVLSTDMVFIEEVSMSTIGNMMSYMLSTLVLGTFTKSLSRADIWDISKRLPVYEEWRTEKFKEVKDEIKQEYHLGSKEFSDAVNLIKENREFSVNIGCEKVSGSITENELKEYASLVKYYSEKSKSDNKGKEIGFDLRKIQKNGEILKKYLSSISMNTLNTLLCFSEMSNSFLAVEHLEEVHDDIVSKAFDGTYLIRKLKQRNICLRILYGMKKCGQVTYAKQLSAALEQEGVELTL